MKMFTQTATLRRQKPSLISLTSLLLSISILFTSLISVVHTTSGLHSSEGQQIVSGGRSALYRPNRTVLSSFVRSSPVLNDVDGNDDRDTADGGSRAVVDDEEDEHFAGDVDCPPTTNPPISVRRITGFQVEIEPQPRNLQEIHVRHNLKVS